MVIFTIHNALPLQYFKVFFTEYFRFVAPSLSKRAILIVLCAANGACQRLTTEEIAR